MVIREKTGNIQTTDTGNKIIDRLILEWFETNKRILHKKTQAGKEVVMKFLHENQQLTQDDIIYMDDTTIIAIEIAACDAIVIYPESMHETAAICYEIGNKHLPLFFADNELLVAYDVPLFRMLEKAGYQIKVEKRKLLNQLKTSVSPHGLAVSNESLFTKIIKRTTKAE